MKYSLSPKDCSEGSGYNSLYIPTQVTIQTFSGKPPSAELRYVEEDRISPSTLIFAAIKG